MQTHLLRRLEQIFPGVLPNHSAAEIVFLLLLCSPRHGNIAVDARQTKTNVAGFLTGPRTRCSRAQKDHSSFQIARKRRRRLVTIRRDIWCKSLDNKHARFPFLDRRGPPAHQSNGPRSRSRLPARTSALAPAKGATAALGPTAANMGTATRKAGAVTKTCTECATL